MVTNVAVAGGLEIAVMLITLAAVVTAILLPVYVVVRLATRPRRRSLEDQRN